MEADGDFIELPKKVFTNADFKDGVCRVRYLVNPARLHRGKNMGSLTVSTVRSVERLRLEVQGVDEDAACRASFAVRVQALSYRQACPREA